MMAAFWLIIEVALVGAITSLMIIPALRNSSSSPAASGTRYALAAYLLAVLAASTLTAVRLVGLGRVSGGRGLALVVFVLWFAPVAFVTFRTVANRVSQPSSALAPPATSDEISRALAMLAGGVVVSVVLYLPVTKLVSRFGAAFWLPPVVIALGLLVPILGMCGGWILWCRFARRSNE